MMARRPLLRLHAAFLLAAVASNATVSQPWYVNCATHGRHDAPRAAAATHGDAGRAAEHGAHGQEGRHAPGEACSAGCCCALTAPPPPAATDGANVTAGLASFAPFGEPASYFGAPAPFLLPFPTGPPALPA